MPRRLRDRIADQALGRMARAIGDDAARWVQSVGLERAASLVARALGERRGEGGGFEPWQRATLGALQHTMCRYDEVDAPLDEANVGRFTNMVKEMSEKVQFLFVSHNKATMEAAHQLSGVTMREPGVSRLVSVDLEEAARLAGAA